MSNIGDIIVLGSYPQNSMDFSKKEPIEWIVLDIKEGNLFCISKYLLDCKPYHKILEKTTWSKCTLRNWLNQDFFQQAFTAEEQRKILVTDIINDKKRSEYNTQDRIFLLSCDEAEKYFEFEERATKTTAYARTQGAWFLNEKEAARDGGTPNTGGWWLRYPGWQHKEDKGLYDGLSCVNFDGYIEISADPVTAADCCVRPALWIIDNEKLICSLVN